MATKPDVKLKRPRRRLTPPVSGRNSSADLLRSIATSSSALYGEHYFHSLTQYLTKTLGMDYAFVGELARDRKETVNVLSACFAGKNTDNFSYSLAGTPCQHIISHGPCTYPRKVQKLFPQDHYLVDLGVECYIGVPLFGSSGQPLGLISVMGRQPLRERETVELVLQIVAARTATEIERQHLHEDLGESYRTLTTLMTNLPGMVYRCRNDKDWTMEVASEGCLALTGYTADDFVSRRAIAYGQLIHPEDQEPVWNSVQAALKESRSFQLVYRITTAKGEQKWVWEQGRGVFSSRGELLALEGFVTDITERRRAEEALRESETRLHSMVNTALNVIIVLDPDHRILEFNPEAERVYGRRREEVLGQDYFDLFLPRDLWKVVDDDLKSVLAGNETRGFENTIRAADGSKRIMIWNVSRMDDANGQPVGVVAIGSDVTERKRGEEIAARFGRVLDSSSNEIYVFDAATLKFVQVNDGARRNLGYSTEELAELTPLDLKPEYTREKFEALIAPLKRREVDTLTFETIHRRKDGSLYPVEVRLQLSYAETPPVFVAVITDITERAQAQERLQYLAHHDSLTGLPNRALFLERLDHALTRARWTKRPLAILFLDLDRFKNINDTLGHDIGDSALRVASERLISCVREGDTVARFGGDEFTVLLEDMANSDDVPNVAQKILDSLSRPFDVEGREFVVTTSIGISLYPNDGDDSLKLLRKADTAMYRAKEQGRNKYQFYSSEMGARAMEKFMLESSLRHALERKEFLLYYQPQVNLATGDITGVEGLLRWQHPELGLILPTQFIPVAEETGLMKAIDEWVLYTACAQAKAWRSAGIPSISMIVNLSGRSFNEARLAEVISRGLRQTGLAPEMLELEITESVIMHNAQATVEMLEQLNRMGLKLAVDDFGTGYSSLSYLKRFPIDTLKIDQSFVRDVTTDADDASLVKAIIAMGHALQLNVIAEGVETPEQLAFLRQHGCDGMQGYLFSRPQTEAEITRLLQSGKKL